MLAVINGKKYNTKTATKVAEFSSNHYCSDFHYYEEALYKSPKGQWFLAGKGNALSPYREACQDGTCGGSDLRLLTPDEAQSWLEEHDFVSEVEEHFTVEEG